MKIFNKTLLIFLTVGVLSLNGMEDVQDNISLESKLKTELQNLEEIIKIFRRSHKITSNKY